jgi:spermidine/putrescine transport system substrate-binding protein
VIVPSDYMVAIMIKSDVVQKLDMSQIPNFKNVGKEYEGLSYDPNNEYSLPYQWGTTGILYNKKEIGQLPESWDPLWDEEFSGEMSMLNDTRETLGAGPLQAGILRQHQGHGRSSRRRPTSSRSRSPCCAGTSTRRRPARSSRTATSCSGTSSAATPSWRSLRTRTSTTVSPSPPPPAGRTTCASPNGAEHPQNAHKFINYILGAKTGAGALELHLLQHPERRALPMIDDALKDLPGLRPPRQRLREVGGDRRHRRGDARVRAHLH